MLVHRESGRAGPWRLDLLVDRRLFPFLLNCSRKPAWDFSRAGLGVQETGVQETSHNGALCAWVWNHSSCSWASQLFPQLLRTLPQGSSVGSLRKAGEGHRLEAVLTTWNTIQTDSGGAVPCKNGNQLVTFAANPFEPRYRIPQLPGEPPLS